MTDLRNWLKKTEANLYIKENYFHHHAFEIISCNEKIKDFFNNSLCQKISIAPRPKKSGKKEIPGINATDLNKQIRICLNKKNNEVKLNLEVNENNGVFYFSGGEKNAIGGFDFAILNHENNLANLRNLCYGELRYHDAEKRWNKFL